MLNITNAKGENIEQDFMVVNYIPASDKEINLKKQIKCDYAITPKQENLFYFKIANNENRKDTATCYFDFSSKDTLIGTKYHFTSSLGEQVFDGNKEFTSLNEQ